MIQIMTLEWSQFATHHQGKSLIQALHSSALSSTQADADNHLKPAALAAGLPPMSAAANQHLGKRLRLDTVSPACLDHPRQGKQRQRQRVLTAIFISVRIEGVGHLERSCAAIQSSQVGAPGLVHAEPVPGQRQASHTDPPLNSYCLSGAGSLITMHGLRNRTLGCPCMSGTQHAVTAGQRSCPDNSTMPYMQACVRTEQAWYV